MSSADIEVLKAKASCNNKEVAKASQKAKQLKLTEDSFGGEDKKTKFYTGLPTFAILMVVFNCVKGKLPKRHLLTQFQQLLIVLLKLRLAIPHADWSHKSYCLARERCFVEDYTHINKDLIHLWKLDKSVKNISL